MCPAYGRDFSAGFAGHRCRCSPDHSAFDPSAANGTHFVTRSVSEGGSSRSAEESLADASGWRGQNQNECHWAGDVPLTGKGHKSTPLSLVPNALLLTILTKVLIRRRHASRSLRLCVAYLKSSDESRHCGHESVSGGDCDSFDCRTDRSVLPRLRPESPAGVNSDAGMQTLIVGASKPANRIYPLNPRRSTKC